MLNTTSITSKKSLPGKKNLDLNNSRNRKLKNNVKNKPMELCMNNINERVMKLKLNFYH